MNSLKQLYSTMNHITFNWAGRKFTLMINIVHSLFFFSLRDTIHPHLENYHLADTLPLHFSDKFPEEITVEQSIDTWKTIVMYLEKHEQEIIK